MEIDQERDRGGPELAMSVGDGRIRAVALGAERRQLVIGVRRGDRIRRMLHAANHLQAYSDESPTPYIHRPPPQWRVPSIGRCCS